MIQSIKEILQQYNIDGDIILYRDADHRKKKLCEYIAKNINVDADTTICTNSDGAFGLYLARAFPNNKVISCCYTISPDYSDAMLSTQNLEVKTQMGLLQDTRLYENFAQNNGYLFIDQFNNKLLLEYYSSYFDTIVNEVKTYSIDAFCDCSHTGATITGFKQRDIDVNTGWQFIVGVNRDPGEYFNYSTLYQDEFMQVTTLNYDTLEIGELIEQQYPNFGNVYEATRSISAAMTWLSQNPNKTVLVYVGDAYTKEGTKFNMISNSQLSSKEMRLVNSFVKWIKGTQELTKDKLTEYYDYAVSRFPAEYHSYIFTLLMQIYIECCHTETQITEQQIDTFCSYISEINNSITQEDVNMFSAIAKNCSKVTKHEQTLEEAADTMYKVYTESLSNNIILRMHLLTITQRYLLVDITYNVDNLQYVSDEIEALREEYNKVHYDLCNLGETLLRRIV